MPELKSNRLTDLSQGSTIDDALGEAEEAIAGLLGIEVDVNYTGAQAVNIDQMGTANGVATLNASSLVVENPANAVVSGATAKIVMTATNFAYISSTWGGTASSIATLNASAEVVQDPANAVTVPGANKIVQADASTFSGGGYVDPEWVGATTEASAWAVVRADSSGALDSSWAGDVYPIITDGTLEYSMNLGGLGAVLTHATGSMGFIATMKTPSGLTAEIGYIYRLSSDGKLGNALADSAAAATGMLVMALEQIAQNTEGQVLVYGFTEALRMDSGDLLYLSSTVAGDVVTAAPTGEGSIVRLVGYGLGSLNGIFFDPDQTWIEL